MTSIRHLSMSDPRHKIPDLKLIPGDRQRSLQIRGISVVATPPENQPFPVEALVEEEDTCLIMSTAPARMPHDIHPLRLMDNLRKFQPYPVGSIMMRKGAPLRLLAIVYDVGQTPVCRPRWVVKALDNIFREADKQKVRSLGLPLLGNRHGRLPVETFAGILSGALLKTPFTHLQRLWIIAEVPKNIQLADQIATAQPYQ